MSIVILIVAAHHSWLFRAHLIWGTKEAIIIVWQSSRRFTLNGASTIISLLFLNHLRLFLNISDKSGRAKVTILSKQRPLITASLLVIVSLVFVGERLLYILVTILVIDCIIYTPIPKSLISLALRVSMSILIHLRLILIIKGLIICEQRQSKSLLLGHPPFLLFNLIEFLNWANRNQLVWYIWLSLVLSTCHFIWRLQLFEFGFEVQVGLL